MDELAGDVGDGVADLGDVLENQFPVVGLEDDGFGFARQGGPSFLAGERRFRRRGR